MIPFSSLYFRVASRLVFSFSSYRYNTSCSKSPCPHHPPAGPGFRSTPSATLPSRPPTAVAAGDLHRHLKGVPIAIAPGLGLPPVLRCHGKADDVPPAKGSRRVGILGVDTVVDQLETCEGDVRVRGEELANPPNVRAGVDIADLPTVNGASHRVGGGKA